VSLIPLTQCCVVWHFVCSLRSCCDVFWLRCGLVERGNLEVLYRVSRPVEIYRYFSGSRRLKVDSRSPKLFVVYFAYRWPQQLWRAGWSVGTNQSVFLVHWRASLSLYFRCSYRTAFAYLTKCFHETKTV